MISWLRKTPPFRIVADFGASPPAMLAFRVSPKTCQTTLVHHETLRVPRSLEGLGRFRALLSALADTMEVVSRREGEAPSKILIGLAHDATVRSVSREVRITRPYPRLPVSLGELRELWREISDPAALHRLVSPDSLKRYQPLFTELESVTLDGRALAAGAVVAGRELVFSFIVSLWPRVYAAAFEAMQPRLAASAPECLPRTAALRNHLIFHRGGASEILLDIGEEETLMLVFNEGSITASRLFPFGSSALKLAIAEEFKMSPSDAEALYRQWLEKMLNVSVARRLEEIVLGKLRLWKREFAFFLEKVARRRVLTPSIFLVGAGAPMPLISASLQEFGGISQSLWSGGEVSVFLPGERESRIFNGWPVSVPDNSVIFGLILRMIQKDAR